MSSGKVVGGILLTGNKLLRMKELPVFSGSNFIDNGGLQINKYSPRDMFARTALGEEGVERIVGLTN